MPTGFTDFVEFARLCVKGMAIAIDQRDEPISTPLRMPEVSLHDINSLANAKINLETARIWSDEEAAAYAADAHRMAVDARHESLAKVRLQNQRCQAMIDKVEAWEPPTPEHDSFKRFMLEQLTTTLYDESWYDRPIPDPLTGEQFREQEITRREQAVSNAENRLADERLRVAERVEWITALNDSLGKVTA